MNDKRKSMNSLASWKRLLLPVCCALALSIPAMPALATELPSGVLNYLRQKDPHVKVRFDAVVMFSNGEIYVPVIPQDPSLNPDSQQVVATFPEKTAYPDLIQFDNNFFLMRLIQTASGRLTFPKMAEYPIQLKEGLLPQDFVLPDNLFIPVELKVILGALPYNPNAGAVKPPSAPTTTHTAPIAPIGDIPKSPESAVHHEPAGQFKSTVRLTYVFDLGEQKLIGIDPLTARKQGDVPLDCVPSSLKLSGDGKLLFAPCLSTNELVVVDTSSNLVKTRVPVGQRPDAVLYLENSQDVVVSNRFSPFLSIVNSGDLLTGQKIDLPGNGGAMAIAPGGKSPQILVADAFKAQIYLVDMNTRAVVKTIKAAQDITSLRAFRDTQGQLRVWATSRTQGSLVVVDAMNDRILKTFEVGAKPVDMAVHGDKLFVVSAGASQIVVVDRPSLSIVATIPLEADSFPSGIVSMDDEKRAYVVSAAANNLVVVNLSTNQVENTFPVDFRANMIGSTPNKDELSPPLEAMSPVVAEPVPSQTDKNKKNPPSAKPEGKRYNLFGKREPAKVEARPAAPKRVTSTAPQAGQKPAANVNTNPLQTNPSKNSASTVNGPAAIPSQPASGSSSTLYNQGNGKFRLMLGRGGNKQTLPPSSLGSTPAQAAKAGVRFSNPNASNLPAGAAKPAETPNSMLMMAPDLSK